MDFLNNYRENVIVPLGEYCDELDKKIKRKWIFASKEEKEKLEKLNRMYNEKVEWLEKQLYIESLISTQAVTKI